MRPADVERVDAVETLDRALRSALTSIEDRRLPLAEAEEWVAGLGAVGAMTRGRLVGGAPHPPDGAHPRATARAAGLLRAALLDPASPDPAATVVRTLRALGQVEEDLSATATAPRHLGASPGELLSEVSHMFRSPLGAIVMLTEPAVDLSADALIHRMGIVHRSALGLAALTEDLRLLGRDEGGPEREATFDLDRTLARIADLVRPVCESRATELSIEANGTGTEVVGRRGTLCWALFDLLLDAALRTKEGTVTLTVRRSEAGQADFEVRGSAGPTEETTPFTIFRVDPESGDYTMSANGVRLQGARRLLDLLACDLHVEERPGEAVARFRLPLAEVAHG